MSEPLIDPPELGTALGDDTINFERAAWAISQAQQACEDVVYPIPAGKLYVLYRVAGRVYMAGGGQARAYQLQESGNEQAIPNTAPGVTLTAEDRADLLSSPETVSDSGTSAFTMWTTPAEFQPWIPGSCRPFASYGQPYW